jgi:hypothetical protein
MLLQAYVAPVTNGVEKVIVCPTHTGLLVVMTGKAGTVFTVTVVVAAALVHPDTVAVTEYVPASAVVTPLMVGFWLVEVNPPGPDQL